VLPVAAAERSARGAGGRVESGLARDHTTLLPLSVRLMNESKVSPSLLTDGGGVFGGTHEEFIYNEAPFWTPARNNIIYFQMRREFSFHKVTMTDHTQRNCRTSNFSIFFAR